MCEGDPIGAGILVAVIMPPRNKENNQNILITCHLYTNGAICVKRTL